MNLLVDANLSPVVSEQLKAARIDASHVYDHDLGTASDDAIAAFAEEVGAAVVSAR
jgi:predicted nuclease of predicted toxin-antitoxin system